MRPDPALSFTLPSLFDDTVLDCRVYHPRSLSSEPNAPPWKRHAAVVAHPYAPLGGSYDDPVVGVVGETLLDAGFLVGTFNFRGSSKSGSRTSWTARPERGDYMSMAGFMVHYVHYLDPSGTTDPSPPQSADSLALPVSVSDWDGSGHSERERPYFVSAGYSYGAMITCQLPPLEHILSRFSAAAVGSAAADVRLRAQHLAEQQSSWLADARSSPASSPRKHAGVRVGGDEDTQGRSHEAHNHCHGWGHRRSHSHSHSRSPHPEAKLKNDVHELLARTRSPRRHAFRRHISSGSMSSLRSSMSSHKLRSKSRSREDVNSSQESNINHDTLKPVRNLIKPQPAYLLVSPPQGIVNHLITLSFSPFSSFLSKSKSYLPFRSVDSKPSKPLPGPDDAASPPSSSSAPTSPSEADLEDEMAAEAKLAANPTLAVFGTEDGFTSVAKYRDWAARLVTVEGTMFRTAEVDGAGHFYVEEGVAMVLRDAVADFAARLLATGA